MTHRRRNDAGFTLLEVLIAAIILSVSLLAVISMQSATVRANEQSAGLRAATMLAQSELARLQSDAMGWQCSTADTPGAGLNAAILTSAADILGGNWVNHRAATGVMPVDGTLPLNPLGLPNADALGDFGARQAHYCVRARAFEQTNGQVPDVRLYEAHVQVFFPFNAQGMASLTAAGDADMSCNVAATVDPCAGDLQGVRCVEVSGGIPCY